MVEFLHVRRWEKRNRTNFYWVMLQCVYNLIVLKHFDTQTLDIVQNLCKYLVILTHRDLM